MVKDGKVDLECGSTTNTRDRQKEVAFAYTTFVAGIKMLAKKSSNINGIEDLRGKTIVVTKGTTSEKMMRQMNDDRVLKLTILETKDHNESFAAVADGRAVAFPMDDVLLYGLISKSSKPDDFAVVGKYLSVEPYAIMLRKDEPAFERFVDRDADRAVPERRDSPRLRALVRDEGPDGADEPVPEGSVRRPEHVSGVAVSRRTIRRRLSVAAALPPAPPPSGSRSPSRGHGLISVASTSFSNSSANRALIRSGSGHRPRSVDDAETHSAVVGEDRHAEADVARLRHPEHQAVDRARRRATAALAGPARWSSRRSRCARAPAATRPAAVCGPAPIAASRPSASSGWYEPFSARMFARTA